MIRYVSTMALILVCSVANGQTPEDSEKNVDDLVLHSGQSSFKALPPLTWHKGEIADVMQLRNGRIATLSPEGDINIWNPQTGERLQTLSTTQPKVIKILLSLDGLRLLGFTRSGTIHQWALPVPKPSWSPEQAVGEPDSTTGDQTTAWASASQDEQDEWLVLEYGSPVKAVAIHVYENFNPGAVIRATTFETDQSPVVLWEGKDPVVATGGRNVARLEISPIVPIKRIKLFIDSKAVAGWNEIDAVGLEDESGTIHWATAAGASSSFAERIRTRSLLIDVSSVSVPKYVIPPGTTSLSHVNDTAEGKQSFGGSGHAVRFTRKDESRLVAIEIFGSWYGSSRPPAEDFSVYVLNKDRAVTKELKFPYAVFQRGAEQWHALSFDAVDVPDEFHIAVFFNANQTKGVFFGKDAEVAESHSFVGTPEKGFKPVDEKFDWMIRAHTKSVD